MASNQKEAAPDDRSPGNLEERRRRLREFEECLGGYAEGDKFELRNKTIKRLAAATDAYIVFVDEYDRVEWSNTEGADTPDGHGSIVAEVTLLQELSSGMTSGVEEFRFTLATALARSFELDIDNARALLSEARGRLSRQHRLPYFAGSFTAAVVSVALLILAVHHRDWIGSVVTKTGADVVMGGLLGSIGAFASVLVRKEQPLTVAARWRYFVDGGSRILLGVLGASLLAILVKANLIVGFAADDVLVLSAVCALSGAVERMVPHLVDRHFSLVDDGETRMSEGTSK